MAAKRRGGCAWGMAMVSTALCASGCAGSSNDPATTGAATPASHARPDDYVSRGAQYPQWGFVTPSSDWICVIGSYPSGGDRTACAAAPDQGPLPIAGVPFAQSPMGGTTTELPNVLSISESSDPAFESIREPIWNGTGTPRTLPEDTVLQVGGFSCNVQASRVSCRNDMTGKGFGFSKEGYELAYADVPAG